jgi:hypothetical protein
VNAVQFSGLLGKQAAQVKQAILPAWGGGQIHLGMGTGPSLEAGYTHALGMLPMPVLGGRLGGEHFGVSAGLPGYVGMDTGISPNRWQWNLPRSLWGYALDSYRGAPDPYEDPEGYARYLHGEPEPKKEKPKKKEKKAADEPGAAKGFQPPYPPSVERERHSGKPLRPESATYWPNEIKSDPHWWHGEQNPHYKMLEEMRHLFYELQNGRFRANDPNLSPYAQGRWRQEADAAEQKLQALNAQLHQATQPQPARVDVKAQPTEPVGFEKSTAPPAGMAGANKDQPEIPDARTIPGPPPPAPTGQRPPLTREMFDKLLTPIMPSWLPAAGWAGAGLGAGGLGAGLGAGIGALSEYGAGRGAATGAATGLGALLGAAAGGGGLLGTGIGAAAGAGLGHLATGALGMGAKKKKKPTLAELLGKEAGELPGLHPQPSLPPQDQPQLPMQQQPWGQKGYWWMNHGNYNAWQGMKQGAPRGAKAGAPSPQVSPEMGSPGPVQPGS